MICDEWRCPGCGLPWDELPVGHSVPVVTVGPGPQLPVTCSISGVVTPADFVRLTSRPRPH